VDIAYKNTNPEISIDYGFSVGSLYCSTEDIGYAFAFFVNGVKSASNSMVTIDRASK